MESKFGHSFQSGFECVQKFKKNRFKYYETVKILKTIFKHKEYYYIKLRTTDRINAITIIADCDALKYRNVSESNLSNYPVILGDKILPQ